MGDDNSKTLIVKCNNSAGVGKKNSDHLTALWWQPLEVTTSRSLCASVVMKESLLLFGISVQGHSSF